MTRFLELWRDHQFDPDLLRVVDNRSERFPSVVREHPILHLWHPGQSFPTDQPRLLIGVATWSGYDMLLLDLIASERLLSDRPNDTTVWVDVFDVAACRSLADFQEYVPGLRAVTHTPVVGVWMNGRLTDSESGAAGRAVAEKYLGVDPDEFEHRARSLHQRIA